MLGRTRLGGSLMLRVNHASRQWIRGSWRGSYTFACAAGIASSSRASFPRPPPSRTEPAPCGASTSLYRTPTCIARVTLSTMSAVGIERIELHHVDDVGREQVGDPVDARLHPGEVGAERETARRQRFEKDERARLLHDRRKDADVAAREEMLELVVREIAGEDHPVAAHVLLRELEVFVEPPRASRSSKISREPCPARGRGRALGIALEQAAVGDDLLDQCAIAMLEPPERRAPSARAAGHGRRAGGERAGRRP